MKKDGLARPFCYLFAGKHVAGADLPGDDVPSL